MTHSLLLACSDCASVRLTNAYPGPWLGYACPQGTSIVQLLNGNDDRLGRNTMHTVRSHAEQVVHARPICRRYIAIRLFSKSTLPIDRCKTLRYIGCGAVEMMTTRIFSLMTFLTKPVWPRRPRLRTVWPSSGIQLSFNHSRHIEHILQQVATTRGRIGLFHAIHPFICQNTQLAQERSQN